MAKEKPDRLIIGPETKVGALLDAYPELESLLIELAPPFAKLRNPVLRKTVAKVTTLRQAAKVGKVDLGKLVNQLRAAAGVESAETFDSNSELSAGSRPAWLDAGEIVESFDARPLLDAGEQPLGPVMKKLRTLAVGQVLELVTPFEPAPLVDAAKEQGMQVWILQDAGNVVKTYFTPTG